MRFTQQRSAALEAARKELGRAHTAKTSSNRACCKIGKEVERKELGRAHPHYNARSTTCNPQPDLIRRLSIRGEAAIVRLAKRIKGGGQ